MDSVEDVAGDEKADGGGELNHVIHHQVDEEDVTRSQVKDLKNKYVLEKRYSFDLA